MRGVCRAAQGMDGPPRRHDRRRVEEADESIHLAVGLREQQLAFGLPLDVRRHLQRMQEARQRGQHLRRRTRRANEGSERPMTPASPAETLTATVNRVCADKPDEFQVFEISLPSSRHYDLNHSSVGSAAFGVFHPTNDDLRALADAADAELARRGAATPQRCKDPTLHAVADAPLRPLSDLLRTATEFDEIAGHLVDEYDLLAIEIARIKAVQAAVRAL